MCLILFAYQTFRDYPLVLAANRDEFYQRPTAPMHFWKDRPGILAGKDLEQGGTWFGIHRKKGRFAALTNFRDPSDIRQNAPSRGEIIPDLLEQETSFESSLEAFRETGPRYNGFNLIYGSLESLFWFSNRKNAFERIEPGIHGLSNRHLDTPWPKIESGKKALQDLMGEEISTDALFRILQDQTVPADDRLPDTGVGLEWERLLSPVFIQSETYGTRSSTAMIVDSKGNIKVSERTFDPETLKIHTQVDFALKI